MNICDIIQCICFIAIVIQNIFLKFRIVKLEHENHALKDVFIKLIKADYYGMKDKLTSIGVFLEEGDYNG